MEIFKNIKGSRGRYKISNLGAVYSTITNKFIKPYKLHKKSDLLYALLVFERGVKGKLYPIHRLVASHFNKMERGDTTAYHVNFVQDDNRVPNLEGCTFGQASARTRRFKNRRKYRGVSKFLLNKSKPWRAILCVGKMKIKTVGYYKTRKAALSAYVSAYTAHYGEAPVNQND